MRGNDGEVRGKVFLGGLCFFGKMVEDFFKKRGDWVGDVVIIL